MSISGHARTTRTSSPPGGPVHGRLYRHGLWPATEVAWLDEPGEDDVLVHRPRPDALAVRVPLGRGRGGDLLLTGAGGLLGRYVLGVARSGQVRTLTTSVPYRTPTGARVVLVARANGVESLELSCVGEDGEGRVFADLRVSRRPAHAVLDLDPLRHRLPGLEPRPGEDRARHPRSA